MNDENGKFTAPTKSTAEQHIEQQDPQELQQKQRAKPVQTEAVNKSGSPAPAESNSNVLTEDQTKERERSINLHLALLEHASSCVSGECSFSDCAKMKEFLKHGEICKVSTYHFVLCLILILLPFLNQVLFLFLYM